MFSELAVESWISLSLSLHPLHSITQCPQHSHSWPSTFPSTSIYHFHPPAFSLLCYLSFSPSSFISQPCSLLIILLCVIGALLFLYSFSSALYLPFSSHVHRCSLSPSPSYICMLVITFILYLCFSSLFIPLSCSLFLPLFQSVTLFLPVFG
jgi:hypothetical protein